MNGQRITFQCLVISSLGDSLDFVTTRGLAITQWRI